MSNSYENFGKYVLLEKLATGGMAEVFLARGMGAGGLGKFFAIKRILPQYADSPEFIEMFKDEAKIAINLNHSNIVSIHEFGIEKGQFFLVMDYVEGRNLRQILNKMKKTSVQFSIDQIVYMMKEVAAGLDHAHRTIDGSTGKPLNITHRDMSPQNIMCTFEGEAKIVDFGIAKAESQIETTRAGTLKGKFGYMSPEQAEGQPVDLRTDVFSLGIVMWELLAHDRLFVANNEINTLRKIRDCQIPSLRKINPNIHTELERIVQKALARDRNLRYQTGAALHRDLNRFLNRQFPDFSTHDFAVFVKSVFADEILSLRKRLVEYARINPADVRAASEMEAVKSSDTALLNADTGSVVITGSAVQTGSRESSLIHEMPSTGNQSINVIQASHEASISIVDATSATHNPDLHKEEATENLRRNSSIDVTVIPQSKNGFKFLDEAALAQEAARPEPEIKSRASRVPDSPENLETDDGEAASLKMRQPSSKRNAESRRPPQPVPTTNTSPRLATILVFSLICFSAYLYLAKYLTETMTPVIAVLDPVLHPVHQALGIDLAQRTVANAPAAPALSTPAPTAMVPAPVVQPAPAPVAEVEDQGIVVTSNPSGGEIFLNDQPTGLSTPNQLPVPSNTNFSIMVRKRGYRDFKRAELTPQSVGHRIDANLVKLNMGYLDVEIFPPQDALLFVNNKPIALRRSLAREIPVPGNTSVRVRAQTRNGSTFEEITVVVPIDHRKAIQINPRKMQRLPSSR